MRERRRGRVGPHRSVIAIAAGALLLAACGGEDPDSVAVASAEQEPDAASEAAVEAEEDTAAAEDTEPEEPEPDVDDAATASAPDEEENAAQGTDDQEGAVDEELALGACDLAGAEDGAPLDVDAYEQATLEANFELELLVTDMAADLDELLSGVSDGPTLEAQLAEHRATYAEAVEPLRGVAPPDRAEDWHGRVMDSFDDVCTAIEDGLAGSAEGDDARFEEFVAALTEFPGLINGLHANAACGPFESC